MGLRRHLLLPLLLFSLASGDFLNKMVPDVDFDHEECDGDACFPKNQVLNIDRTKRSSSGLTYHERSLAYASTKDMLDVCLPKVDKNNVADWFESCNDKKMEDVCVFAKRGWLIKDASSSESVADVNLLKQIFGKLEGGEEARKECLNEQEENEVFDEDYWYDYYDYYDAYDYLARSKRSAGKKDKNKNTTGKGNGGKKKGRKNNKNDKNKKGKKKNNKRAKRKNKNKGNKKGNRKNNKKSKKGGRNRKNDKNKKDKEKKNKGKKGKEKEERKYVSNDKGAGKDKEKNDDKVNKRLAQLGFSKVPKKSTLDGLNCLWDRFQDLFIRCGEKTVSDSP